MRSTQQNWKNFAAAAVMGAFILTGGVQQVFAQDAGCPAQPEKKVKDNTEYDLSNAAFKDINNPTKEIQDLDTWTEKYPDSDWKDTRLYMYMQAYSKTNPPQPAKVLDYGSQLMSKDLKCIFVKEPQTPLSVMFLMSSAFLQLPTPTQDQIAQADKVAHQLLDYSKTFFTADKKPAATSDADWAKARQQVETVANAALVRAAAAPGNAAMAQKPPDCAAAETAYAKALGDFPESPGSGDIAYNLGKALICQQETKPEKVPQALYEIARAVSLPPDKGGLDPQTRAKIDDYLKKVYSTYHGSEEGLDQLKQQAAASPLPPSGFTIQSKAQADAAAAQQFAQQHPELALWKGIKDQLTSPQGAQYFESQMKNAAVPKLRGVVVEGRPACHSRELLVAVPLQPGAANTPEITLKLDAPLNGKPEPGSEIQWEGVPTAFTQTPFMLTMDIMDKAKIEGLKTTPCGVTKKSVRKK